MKRIAADYIYTLDGNEPLLDGFVEYDDDGTVVSTGVSRDVSSEENYIKGAIVPGFVNAHCHIELSYMWKLFRKGTGMAGFIDQINSLRDTCAQEKKEEDIRHWMKVLWDRGVSAMCDISNCADSFAIKRSSPMYTRTFLEVFGTEPEDCERVMRSVRDLSSKAASFGLDAAPTPHACYTMSPELLTESSREGLLSGFLSYHSEETQEEEEMLKYGSGAMWENRRKAGMSVPPLTGKSSLLYFIDRLEKIHPSPFEENILLVHEVCMDEEGIEAVKRTMLHPYIALCPLSNLFIHNQLPPVDLMLSKGLKLTVGTDSLSSNDDLDMVGELRCLGKNFPQVTMNDLFTWACRDGAEFLKKDDTLGTIEAGKSPGLVAVTELGPDGRFTDESKSYRIV